MRGDLGSYDRGQVIVIKTLLTSGYNILVRDRQIITLKSKSF